MLQQTRVDTVERYYGSFLRRFPDVATLASAAEDAVVESWSGLGYYRRARLLHAGARYVHEELGGRIPQSVAELRKIPGVGAYTAGAISSIAFDQPGALVDGNVARLLSRVLAIREPREQGADARAHWDMVRAIIECGSPRVLAQALMELGATVCTPKSPNCLVCPVRRLCETHAQGLQEAIPATRRKKTPTVERWAALGLVSRNRIMLVRRPDEGLLRGMWCLPLVDCDKAGNPQKTALARLASAPATLVSKTAIRHVFSHRVWQLFPNRVELPRRPDVDAPTQWVAPAAEIPGGVPSVTRKLLRAFGFD